MRGLRKTRRQKRKQIGRAYGYVFENTDDACLQLAKASEESEAKKIYRDASRKFHPDKGGNAEDFKKLGGCFETFWPVSPSNSEAVTAGLERENYIRQQAAPPPRAQPPPQAARQEAARQAERRANEEQAAQEAARQEAAREAQRRAAEEAARREAARREAQRRAAEEAARQEALRKAAEEAARREAQRRAAEEAARQEALRKAAEEAARQEALRKAAEEAAQIRANREKAKKKADSRKAKDKEEKEKRDAYTKAVRSKNSDAAFYDMDIDTVSKEDIRKNQLKAFQYYTEKYPALRSKTFIDPDYYSPIIEQILKGDSSNYEKLFKELSNYNSPAVQRKFRYEQQFRFGGQKYSRTSSRGRLPSLPTRRVRRFSSSKKRRYSHRQRA
jgi:chemotaxis protein histidine kinase CheA